MNELLIFAGMSDYATALSCVNENSMTASCVEHNRALAYCAENGFYSLRVQQYNAAKRIMRDFLDTADRGENSLYAIIGICMGVVILSSALISVILIVVIKDKSYVMAIFAEIKEEEIRRVIRQATSFPITNVRFRLQHVYDCKGNEDKYWRSVVRDQVSPDKKRRLPSVGNNESPQRVALVPDSAAVCVTVVPRPTTLFRNFSYGNVLSTPCLALRSAGLQRPAQNEPRLQHMNTTVANFTTGKELLPTAGSREDLRLPIEPDRAKLLRQIEYLPRRNNITSCVARS